MSRKSFNGYARCQQEQDGERCPFDARYTIVSEDGAKLTPRATRVCASHVHASLDALLGLPRAGEQWVRVRYAPGVLQHAQQQEPQP